MDAKVFRRLVIDQETRLQMAQVNNLLAGDSPSPGTTFEHTITDTFFPMEMDMDMDGGEANDDNNDVNKTPLQNNKAFPLPWKRVPNAADHATVVSMVRMALDCYVDPKRQGWVDIGDNWDVSTEIGWLEAGLRGYIFASEDQKTIVIGIKGTSLKLFGTGGGPTGNNDKLNVSWLSFLYVAATKKKGCSFESMLNESVNPTLFLLCCAIKIPLSRYQK
jgi:hypothetical protein